MQLNGTQFDAIAAFALNVSWDFVFGANVGTARSAITNTWDASPLIALLGHARRTNLSFYGLELGNEPDLMCVGPQDQRYSCHQPPANTSWAVTRAIEPKQLAADFARFMALVRAQQPSARVIGNDISWELKDYAAPFLRNLSQPLDAFSWHHYYGPGGVHGLNASQFSEPATLDRFLHSATAAAAVAVTSGRGAALWLGETSSTYGGGTRNASASFAAGFLWLDKLGIAATTGHHVVCRQTFARSSYSVIGARNTHTGQWDALPNPDYWSTLLWRRLVGPTVLSTSDQGTYGREPVELKVHVQHSLSLRGDNVTSQANHRGVINSTTTRGAGYAELYLLTSSPGVITSRDVLLNGRVLQLADEQTGALPPLAPLHLKADEPIRFDAKSYGFVVLPQAGVARCRAPDGSGAQREVDHRGRDGGSSEMAAVMVEADAR